MLHKEFNNGLRAYPIHQAVQAKGSTAWCQDWYDDNYYKISPKENPQGPQQGSVRVFRGGGWFNDARVCRSAVRNFIGPGFREDYLGFRLSRSVALGP
jgi:formylglycine-generating enzyme required for sulfatase activity